MDVEAGERVVLVTGASRGLGREVALQFARAGCDVALNGRNVARLDAVADEVRRLGRRAVVVSGDLDTAERCQVVVDDAAVALGRLDVLVANASGEVRSDPSRLEDLADDVLFARVHGKATASIRCVRAAIPHLRASPNGRVVLIGGTSARSTLPPVPGAGTAGSTSMPQGLGNAVLANFARHVVVDLARDAITINTVHPHLMRSERHDERVGRAAAEFDLDRAAAERRLAAGIPIGRVPETAEVASLVVFLASPLAGAITGQSIAVDGGALPGVNY